ncbi:hypothetical protein TSUD_253610 [Trifolium subterraneum]|nr:hypothetical protein TSUD_253610 [Trifolium subterraneum]
MAYEQQYEILPKFIGSIWFLKVNVYKHAIRYRFEKLLQEDCNFVNVGLLQEKTTKSSSLKKNLKDYHNVCFKPDNGKRKYIVEEENEIDGKGNITSKIFSYHELCVATKNFHVQNMVGEGGFGRVYKGRIKSMDNKKVD